MPTYDKEFLKGILIGHGYNASIMTPEWCLFALSLIQTSTLERIEEKLNE